MPGGSPPPFYRVTPDQTRSWPSWPVGLSTHLAGADRFTLRASGRSARDGTLTGPCDGRASPRKRLFADMALNMRRRLCSASGLLVCRLLLPHLCCSVSGLFNMMRTNYSRLRIDSREAALLTCLDKMSAYSAGHSFTVIQTGSKASNTASRKTEVCLASAMYS